MRDLRFKDSQAENEGMERRTHEYHKLKKIQLTVHVSVKTDFKSKTVSEGKEGHCIMIIGLI